MTRSELKHQTITNMTSVNDVDNNVWLEVSLPFSWTIFVSRQTPIYGVITWKNIKTN